MTAPPAAAIEVRRLTFADLPQVVAIERRVFPTPWSLAMFVLELSKPSGISLAAETVPTDGEGATGPRAVAGFLICSRYVSAWHVMNVSVDLGRRRQGIATALLTELFARAGGDAASYTLEVRESNAGAIRLYQQHGFAGVGTRRGYYADTREDALIMWRTPGTLRGTLDDVPGL